MCNEHRYGYINVPVKSHQGLEDERVNFIHLILEALGEGWGTVPPACCQGSLPPHGAPFLRPCTGAGIGLGVPALPLTRSMTLGKSPSLLGLSLTSLQRGQVDLVISEVPACGVFCRAGGRNEAGG